MHKIHLPTEQRQNLYLAGITSRILQPRNLHTSSRESLEARCVGIKWHLSGFVSSRRRLCQHYGYHGAWGGVWKSNGNIVHGCHLSTQKVTLPVMKGSAKMLSLPARGAYLLCPTPIPTVLSRWIAHWNLHQGPTLTGAVTAPHAAPDWWCSKGDFRREDRERALLTPNGPRVLLRSPVQEKLL
jgi:hypothetical protein